MVVSQAVDSLREALLLAHPALRTRKQQSGRSFGGSHYLLLFLNDAGDFPRNRDRMFSFHLTLHESQIECAPSILRQTVQRQLQEFTDAHSTLLKNEDHLHPRS